MPTKSESDILTLLKQVKDPEIPVLDIAELGVLRKVYFEEDEVVVEITPTYSGCPAMQAITSEIGRVLTGAGFRAYKVKTVLSPAWTTDWMNENARRKLVEYGIAAPGKVKDHLHRLRTGEKKPVKCPFCESVHTSLTSAFGSTACKALHYCNDCSQPFEEFKCH